MKKLTTKWTPKEVEHNHLREIPFEKLKGKLGSMGAAPHGSTNLLSFLPSNLKSATSTRQHVVSDTMPKSFDSRTQWPNCTSEIRDQGYCGSCWAFSSAGFLTDRYCIHSDGQIKVTLSPQDMVGCDLENFGC